MPLRTMLAIHIETRVRARETDGMRDDEGEVKGAWVMWVPV